MTEVVIEIKADEALRELDRWLQFASVQGEFGWIEGMSTPDSMMKAFRMEYEWAERPGYQPWAILRSVWLYGQDGANLANDIETLYRSGLRGIDLMEGLASTYAEYLRQALLSVMSPPLSKYTIMDKEMRKKIGKSHPGYPPEKIWIDTAETFENITHRVVPVGSGESSDL